MNVLITGGKGQLGRMLIHQLEDQGDSVQTVVSDLDTLDIADAPRVAAFVAETRPDVIVNCAALTDVDGCEANEATAYRVNALGARNLAAAAYRVGAKILQVSTDYVFDGLGTRPLREDDPINPQSVYGRSKAWGEQLVRATNPRHFIVRTAWLYGDGKNFVRTVLLLAKERREIAVVRDQVGSPTSTKDLARCIMGLIQTERYGTYHGTCQGACSRYELAQAIVEIAGLSTRVAPVTTEMMNPSAKRPKYAVLDNFLLRLEGLDTFRPWEEALEEYLRRLKGKGDGPLSCSPLKGRVT